MSKQRDRGRILTSEALTKLQQALRDWEVQHEKKCTQERIKELTGKFKEGGLDPGTISKILKGKEGVDPESIRYLLGTFGLQLEEADLVAAIAFTTQSDPNFVGREGAIADLKILIDRDTKVIVIQARGGVGKTTLARKYLQQEFGTFLEFPIAKETKDIASVESLIEEKLRQLGEEPGREFLVSIDRLKRKLQSERIGILIDNLEPALDSAGKLIEAHRRYVELLRVLADPTVRSLTLITTRERLREPSITVQHYPLRSLDVTAWETYFQSRNIATDESALSALHNAYGGNAKAMDILSGAIAEDFSGDIAAYWQVNQDDLLIERDLEDLVTTQFNRIQELDRDAYNLLCRMGCYRYQDVPRVPIEGLLCLLWDVAEGQRRRVVKALQDRSLVDCQDGEYWLHPVIRGEAIGRLRISEDWGVSNQVGADYWSKSTKEDESIENALRALEAYYHYVMINSLESACDVLVREKRNKSLKSATLCGALFRLGLYHQMASIITQILNSVKSNEKRSILYDNLGDVYIAIGNISEAFKCNEELGKIGDYYSLRSVKTNSLIRTALCKIKLWELEQALELIERARVLNRNSEHESIPEMIRFYFANYEGRSIIIDFYLAFLKSSLDFSELRKDILQFAEATEIKLLTSTDLISSRNKGYGFVLLGATYRNLECFDKASQIYSIALSFAKESHYIQVEAMALNGLAELNRKQKNIDESIKLHLDSLEIFRRINSKCELADAHYQVGITYQSIGDIDKCNENFQEAIRIFTEMEAPKQVERVRRSMNGLGSTRSIGG